MFPWVANFRGLTVGFARPLILSRTYITKRICLTENKICVFHPLGRGGGGGGNCPIFLHLNTHDLLLLLCYTTVSLNFGRCPISELTTHSPRMVNNSTMHPHPTRRDVTVHMKCNHAISCDVMLHAPHVSYVQPIISHRRLCTPSDTFSNLHHRTHMSNRE